MCNTRQFKFRAWDNESNKYRDMVPCTEEWFDSDCWDDPEQHEDALVSYPSHPFRTFGDRLTYEQWTGLTDRTGKDVYEGDIVHIKEHDFYHERDSGSDSKGEVWRNVLVVWADYGFKFRLNQYRSDEDMGFAEWIEIVGNRHQNPELLT